MTAILKQLPLVYLLFATGTLLYLFSSSVRSICNKVVVQLTKFNTNQNALLWAAISFLLGLTLITNNHAWGDDFAQYIAQAKALVTGEMDTWLEKSIFLYDHSVYGLGTVVYPWGTSLLLAPVYALFGFNLIAFKLLEALCLFGSIFFLGRFFQRRFPVTVAFLCTMFIGINQSYLQCVNDVQSNLPCLLFTCWTIDLIDLHNSSEKPSFGLALAIGVVGFLAVIQRTLAMALFVALFLYDAWYFLRKKYTLQELITKRSVPYMTFVILFVFYKILLPSYGGYGGYFHFDLVMIMDNVHNYYNIFRQFFCDYWSGYFDRRLFLHLITIVFYLTTFYGMWKYRKKELYCIFYSFVLMAVLFLFDGTQGVLYVLPVFPFLFMFSAYTVWDIYQSNRFNLKRIIPAFVGAMLLTMFLFDLYLIGNVRSADKKAQYAYSPNAKEVYQFINDTIPDDKIIYFFKPRALSLMTDVYSYWCDPKEENWDIADYILISNYDLDQDAIREYLTTKDSNLVFQNGSFELFEVAK